MLDGARLTAYDVLDGVSSRGAYANLLLPQLLRERQLDERDAAFATQLAYGALRAQGTLDAVLTGLVSRPLAELDPRVLDLLRLGAYQLIDLRVPVARRRRHDGRPDPGHRRHRRLRPGQRRPAEGRRRGRPRAVAGPPRWGRRRAAGPGHQPPALDRGRLAAALGGDDELEAALLADDAAPEVHLVARRIDREDLVEESGASPGPWSPFAVRLHGGDPGRLPSVRSGAAAVQDEGSQLAALLLARAPLEGTDAAWLDMCAGPGGKSGLLAAVRPEGVRLTAADRAPHRAELVRKALAGEDDVEVLAADGLAAARGRRDRSTGCCWTRRAPGWARCAAGRRCAGGARPTTSRRWSSCRRGCWTARWLGAGRRRRGLRDLLAAHRGDRGGRGRGGCSGRRRGAPGAAAVPRRAGHGARRARAAVAAPARHRRDVHGPAPPHPLTPVRTGRRSRRPARRPRRDSARGPVAEVLDDRGTEPHGGSGGREQGRRRRRPEDRTRGRAGPLAPATTVTQASAGDASAGQSAALRARSRAVCSGCRSV